MSNVVPFAAKVRAYEAKQFSALTIYGQWLASGTLCGHVDLAPPDGGTYTLSPDEAEAIITMLKQARHDVLDNSNPTTDPRIYERE